MICLSVLIKCRFLLFSFFFFFFVRFCCFCSPQHDIINSHSQVTAMIIALLLVIFIKGGKVPAEACRVYQHHDCNLIEGCFWKLNKCISMYVCSTLSRDNCDRTNDCSWLATTCVDKCVLHTTRFNCVSDADCKMENHKCVSLVLADPRDSTYCMGRGVSSSLSATCSCRGFYSGRQCESCPEYYDQQQCFRCVGYFDQLTFTCRDCFDKDCPSHSTAVGVGTLLDPGCKCEASCNCLPNSTLSKNQSLTSCTCNCKDGFAGFSCEKCADGFSNFPNCELCTCQIKNAIPTVLNNTCDCSNCDVGYKTPCDQCQTGYGRYPNCIKCDECAVLHSTGIPNSDCTCTCLERYAGITCNSCDVGSVNYPNCVPDCSGFCSQIGSDDIGIFDTTSNTCKCNCRERYSGDRCSECSPCLNDNYSPATINNNCECRCVDGLSGELCDKIDCTLKCENNGTISTTSCVCECGEQYGGDICDECSKNLTNYPLCVLPVEPEIINTNDTDDNNNNETFSEVESFISNDTRRPVDEDIQKRATQSGLIGSLAGSSSLLQGSRLVVVSTLCADTDILRASPVRFSLGKSRDSSIIGVLTINILFVAVIFLIHFILSRMYSPARVMFPYLSFIPWMFSFDSIAVTSLKLIVSGSAFHHRLYGVGSFLIFNVGLVATTLLVNGSLPKGCTYFIPKIRDSATRCYVLGLGEWVSISGDQRVRSWGILFEMYRPGFALFAVVEQCLLIVVSAVKVVEAEDMPTCEVLAGILCGTFVFTAIAALVLAPWAARLDIHFTVTVSIVISIACLFLIIGFHSGDRENGAFAKANALLDILSWVIFIKACIDPCLLLYVEWSRRPRLQRKLNIDVRRKSVEVTLIEDDDVSGTQMEAMCLSEDEGGGYGGGDNTVVSSVASRWILRSPMAGSIFPFSTVPSSTHTTDSSTPKHDSPRISTPGSACSL